jgi:YD repeat-containing protein
LTGKKIIIVVGLLLASVGCTDCAKKYELRSVKMNDGSDGLLRVNLETGQACFVGLPAYRSIDIFDELQTTPAVRPRGVPSNAVWNTRSREWEYEWDEQGNPTTAWNEDGSLVPPQKHPSGNQVSTSYPFAGGVAAGCGN